MIKPVRSILAMQDQQQAIDRGLRRLLNCEAARHINQIILFGSGARGELTDLSDVDLCIILDNGADIKCCKKIIFSAPREPGDETVYDILCFENRTYLKKIEVGGVCEIIKQDGKVLYQKEMVPP